ncbi:MAG: DNA-protecting protein DprA [Planctomycetes bacterium]|nr:DNA-protecting protein DprA [Planctomycetota bacterium]
MTPDPIPVDHPPLDPALVDWIHLHLAGIYQPEVLEELLERFGDPGQVFELGPEAVRQSLPLPPEWLQKLFGAGRRREAELELELCRKKGVQILRRDRPGWLKNLDGLPLMPLLLFARGAPSPLDEKAIAVIGSRRPSPYGLRQARKFAGALASSGMTVVSGLARGIDGEAHRAALEAGGRTLAVLGSGFGHIYPAENRPLAQAITEGGRGRILTEFPFAMPPLQHHFPQRNRLLSGLSLGTLVVEAGERSGSLLTVEWALKQGRPVFAVPGRVDQPEARGCLRLIQNGAYPVLEPEEILEALLGAAGAGGASRVPGGGRPESKAPSAREDPFLKKLLPLFDEEDAWHPDALIDRLGVEASVLWRELARLESEGRIEKQIGGKYVLIMS